MPRAPLCFVLPCSCLLSLGVLLGCGDADPPTADSTGGSSSAPGPTGDEPSTTGATRPSAADTTPDPTADDSTGGTSEPTGDPSTTTEALGSGSDSSEGGSSSGGLELEGDPPEPRAFVAIDDGDFELLADDDEFTTFSNNGDRVQILPLRDENFPPDVDYCTAGSDETLNELQQWARARLRAEPKTWYYDVTITVVAEEDGESEFALVIDGDIVDVFRSPVTDDAPGVDDMDDVEHTWSMIPIVEGASVEIWGKAHSNLGLEEGAGCRDWSPTYAWARGRWRRLELVASPGV